MKNSSIVFHLSRAKIGPVTHRVTVKLARPIEFREVGDCEFETLGCRAINAGILDGNLPVELEPYRGWTIRHVTI